MSSESAGKKDLADRYAAALYALAEESGRLDAVAGDLRTLSAAVAADSVLKRFLSSPLLSRAEQTKAVAAAAEKAGFSILTRNFLGVLAANRRLPMAAAAAAAFLERLAHARGEISAEVVSAQALSGTQAEALTKALQKALGANVAVSARVDPSILGGLIVQVGSRMMDGSLRTKLQKLQLAMKGVG